MSKIDGVTVTLHEIMDGPNKGNWLGVTHKGGHYGNFIRGTSKEAADNGYSYNYKYVVGKERVPGTAASADIGGEVATDGMIWAVSDSYEYSLALSSVTTNNAYGIGHYSEETGAWVSEFSISSGFNNLVEHEKDEWTDAANLLPSPKIFVRAKPKVKVSTSNGVAKKANSSTTSKAGAASAKARPRDLFRSEKGVGAYTAKKYGTSEKADAARTKDSAAWKKENGH